MPGLPHPSLSEGASGRKGDWYWVITAFVIILIFSFGFRWGSGVLGMDRVWDEVYMLNPINDIIEKGWAVETAIDFQEAKGPAMIWV